MYDSDPNTPPFLYGLVIVAVLVTYAYGGLAVVALGAAAADIAMRRVEFVRRRNAAQVPADLGPTEHVTGRGARDS